MALLLFILAPLITSPPVSSETESLILGNQPSEIATARGPASVITDMSGCRFSIVLTDKQHLIFNGPDVIFYQSPKRLPSNELPYLSQASITSGYEWNFLKNGNLATKWFGLMCERKSNLPLAASEAEDDPNQTLELRLVRESNGLKCPAIHRHGMWEIPATGKTDNIIYKTISDPKWSGFILGYPRKDNPSTVGLIRFCLIHNESVLIGASENHPEPVAIPRDFLDTIERLLSSIEFID